MHIKDQSRYLYRYINQRPKNTKIDNHINIVWIWVHILYSKVCGEAEDFQQHKTKQE